MPRVQTSCFMKYYLFTLCLGLSLGLMAQSPPATSNPPSTTPPPAVVNTGTSTGSGSGTTFNTGSSTNTNTPPPTNDRTMGLGARLRAGLANNANLQASVASGSRRETPPTPRVVEDTRGMDENNSMMDDEEDYFIDYTTQAFLAYEDSDYEIAAIYLELAADELDVTDESNVLVFFEAVAVVSFSLNYEEEDTEAANELLTIGNAKLAEFTSRFPATEDNAYFYDQIGYVYYELDFHEEALQYFYTSIQAYPEDAEIAYMVASTAALTGQDEAALNFLEYALSLGYYEQVLADDEMGADYISTDGDLQTLVKYQKYQELKQAYGF